MFIEDYPVKATIDTGATSSFVKDSLVNVLKVYARTTPRSTEVRMADNTKRVVSEALIGKAKFGQHQYDLTLLVLPEATDDMVLGMDFLFQTGTTISIADQTTTLEKTPPLRIQFPRCTVMRSPRDTDATKNSTANSKYENIPVTHAHDNEEILAHQTDSMEIINRTRTEKLLAIDLSLFDALTGTTDLAKHRITMRDD